MEDVERGFPPLPGRTDAKKTFALGALGMLVAAIVSLLLARSVGPAPMRAASVDPPIQTASPEPPATAAPLAIVPEAPRADARATAAPEVPEAAALDQTSFRRVVLEHMAAFQGCYESELRAKPGLRGRVTVHVDIDPAGVVASARATDDSLEDPAVAACVESAASRLRFPPDRPGSFSFPFLFDPGGPG